MNKIFSTKGEPKILSKEFTGYINWIKSLNRPPLHTLSLKNARALNKFIKEYLTDQSSDLVLNKTENKIIKTLNFSIPVRIYYPLNYDVKSPTIFYFHGGGWTLCSLDTHDSFCKKISFHTGLPLISVDYSLSPEAKFPKALNEATELLLWFQNNHNDLGIANNKTIIAGDSAGGNIAAALVLKARELHLKSIKAQLLIYPALDFNNKNYESYKKYSNGYLLDDETIIWFEENYLNKRENGFNYFASPILEENLSNLPRTCILTAEFDPIRDHGEFYAEKLSKFSVDVSCIRYNGMVHGFFLYDGIFKQIIDPIILDLANTVKNFTI